MSIATSHEVQRIWNNVYDDSLNKIRVDASLTVGSISIPADGAIADGANSAIKATVFDYTNSNPLAVRLTDINGDYAAVNATISGTIASSIVNPSTYITNASIPVSFSSTVNSSILNPSSYITNASIPVTGSFYQGTQPVSIASTLNASIVNASTYITNASIPVTGSFYQGTQPVSLAATVNTSILNASTYITNASIPVTGSFYQGTQPVSLAATVNTSVLNPSSYITNASLPVTGTFYQTTQPVSLASTVNTSILNAVGANSVPIQDGGNSITVDGSVTVTQATGTNLHAVLDSGTTTVTQATGTNLHSVIDSGTVTTVSTVTNLSQMGGVAISLNTGVRDTGTQRVTIATNDVVPASQSGTWNMGTLTTLTTANTLSSLVGGGTLTDAAVNLNPLNIGARVAQANPTAMSASGDLVNLMADDLGRLVVVKNHVRDLVTQNTITLTASTTETSIFAAGGVGVFQDLSAITVANTSASTNTRVDFRDATAGTVRFSLQCPGNSTVGIVFDTPFNQTTANNTWTAQCGTSVTDIRIMGQAVKNV